jgi:hypothetical protein
MSFPLPYRFQYTAIAQVMKPIGRVFDHFAVAWNVKTVALY